MGRGWLVTFLILPVLSVMIAPDAIAQTASVTAAPGQSVVNGVVIDGPPPPEPPAVESRGADGRATFRANRLPAALRVDGRLDEEFYLTTPPITNFYQMEPDNGQLATEQTAVWIFFDDRTLYVAVRCFDSAPEERWVANEMRRDSTTISRQNEAFPAGGIGFFGRAADFPDSFQILFGFAPVAFGVVLVTELLL